MSARAEKDPKAVQKWYRFLKLCLADLLPVDDETKVHLVATNANKALSYILKFFDPKAVNHSNPDRKLNPVQKVILFKAVMTAAIAVVDGVTVPAGNRYFSPYEVEWKSSEIGPKIAAHLKTVYEFDMSSLPTAGQRHWRSQLFPLITIALFQVKLPKELQFGSNVSSQRKGLIGVSMPHNTGYAISNRFKKSAPEMLGAVNNIWNYFQSYQAISQQQEIRGQKRKRGATQSVNVGGTAAQLQSNFDHFRRVCNKQLIGVEQRKLLEAAVENGDINQLNILVQSLNVIKPRVVHKFHLLPEIIIAADETKFEGAGMSGLYPFTMWNLYAKETYTRYASGGTPPIYWEKELQFHRMFRSGYENLKVLTWMFSNRLIFHKRSEWPAKTTKTILAHKGNLQITRGSKALKGAPVNLGRPQSSVSQLATQKSFAGKTAKNDRNTNIESALKASTSALAPTGGGTYADLEAEIAAYKAVKVEGTSEWHTISTWNGKHDHTDSVIACDVGDEAVLFYD